MLAASYWSLLAPAIGMAEDSGKYGAFAFVPVAVGFTLGAAFVYLADLVMPMLVRNTTLLYNVMEAHLGSDSDYITENDQFSLSYAKS